jgi:type III secretion protein L
MFRIDSKGISAAPGVRLIKADEWAEWQTAEDLLAAARKSAEELRLESVQALEKEKQRGYEQGLLQGRQEHAEQMMDTVLKSIDYIEGLEKGLSSLVGDALRKILGALPPEDIISGVVRQSLALVRGQRQVILRVSPQDEPRVKARLDDIMREYPSISFVDLQSDGRMPPGGCTLQSDMGVIDAGVETQIRAIISTLEKRRKG